MKNKKNDLIVFIISPVIFFTLMVTIAFCFYKSKGAMTETQIISDKGDIIYLREYVNPSSTDILMKNIDGDDKYHILLCPSKKHVIYSLDGYYPEPDVVYSLKYHSDFSGMRVYYVTDEKFFYLSDHYRDMIWIDLERDKFCGSYYFPAYDFWRDNPLKAEDYKEQYLLLKDFYVENNRAAYKRLDEALATKSYNELSSGYDFANYAYSGIYRFLRDYDKPLAEKLSEENGEYKKKIEDYQDILRNMGLLKMYTCPVSKADERYREFKYYEQYREVKKGPRPDIKEELPVNEAELQVYLKWIRKYDIRDNKSNIKYDRFGYRPPEKKLGPSDEEYWDYYGNPLKFELTGEGLKVTSAGRDGIFGTEDDQYFLSKYTEAHDEGKKWRREKGGRL